MCDRFADVGTLENVLLSPRLALESKRQMLLVSHFFHDTVDAYLRQPELHVDEADCTIPNARWIVRVLLPRVPGLCVCARGEVFAPRMDLAKLAALPKVRVSTRVCSMGSTAAFFLGHALERSNGHVRLLMGRAKSLKALRERNRIFLDWNERLEHVDCCLMAGALLANAERRIAAFNGNSLDLSRLYLNEELMQHLFWQLFDQFEQHHAPYYDLDLAENRIGPRGVKLFVDALCNRRGGGGWVKHLDLRATDMGNCGMEFLTAPMRCVGLEIQDLCVAEANIGDYGMELLMQALRAPFNQHEFRDGRRQRIVPPAHVGIRFLDVSGNPFGNKGFAELLCGFGMDRLETLCVRNLRSVSKQSFIRMGEEVRKGLYPAIEQISSDCDGVVASKQVPVYKAVQYWDLQRRAKQFENEWQGYVDRCKKHEELAETARQRKLKRALHEAMQF